MNDLLRMHPNSELHLQIAALHHEISKLRHLQACNFAALALEMMGFTPKEGWFTVDIANSDNHNTTRMPHAWAKDDFGLVELTGEQFNPFLYQQNQFPAGIVIVTPDQPMYKRYTAR